MDRRNFIKTSSIMGLASLGATSVLAQTKGNVPAEASADSRFNVLDFGAKGDGKTSDTAAIQKALDAAGKINGTVWFPSGTYRCHDLKVPAHVTLLADPVWIFRTEKAGAVLELDSETADCVLDITGAFGVHVHGLIINGIRSTAKTIHGILLNNTQAWSKKEDTLVIDDTKVMNFSGHGLYMNRVWLFIIRHSQFMSNKGDGVCLKGWDGFVTDNQFSGNGGNGFGCEDVGATVMFTANRVEWNHGYGLKLLGGDDWNITGNSFDRNYGAGLSAKSTSAVAITGNVFRRCGKDSKDLAEGEQSCHVKLDGCKGLSMTGNSFLAGQDDGGKGLFTPQVGLMMKDLQCSVITGNTLWHGYMNTMFVDKGGHKDCIIKDNVGCKMED